MHKFQSTLFHALPLMVFDLISWPTWFTRVRFILKMRSSIMDISTTDGIFSNRVTCVMLSLSGNNPF